MINNKLLVYNMYIIDSYVDNSATGKIYDMHFIMLNKICPLFDEIIFILTYNGNNNDQIVLNFKKKLIEECSQCPKITFIFEKNNANYREGIIYKKYIIDKLNEYDGLTMFGHSKGVTNSNNINYLDNTLLWIYSLYYLNTTWNLEVFNKLDDNPNCKYITYGGLYFKDRRHNIKYNWFYSGSFYWLNTKKLLKYITDNNIDYSSYLSKINEHGLMRCAELFPGNIIPEEYAAFHFDEHFNKQYNHFLNYGNEISYRYIDMILKRFLRGYEYDELIASFNEVKSIIMNRFKQT